MYKKYVSSVRPPFHFKPTNAIGRTLSKKLDNHHSKYQFVLFLKSHITLFIDVETIQKIGLLKLYSFIAKPASLYKLLYVILVV